MNRKNKLNLTNRQLTLPNTDIYIFSFLGFCNSHCPQGSPFIPQMTPLITTSNSTHTYNKQHTANSNHDSKRLGACLPLFYVTIWNQKGHSRKKMSRLHHMLFQNLYIPNHSINGAVTGYPRHGH